MIKFYKLKKKEFHEAIIKGHIKYNLKRIEVYKSTSANQIINPFNFDYSDLTDIPGKDRIQVYKTTVINENINGYDFEDYPALAKSYDEKVLDKFHKRYNVDYELIKESILTENLALEQYDKLTKKRDIYLKEIEIKNKVTYYKKAIMELKREGQI